MELVPDEPMTSRYAKIVRGSLVAFSFFTEHCPNIKRLSFALEDVTREAIDAVYKACANRFQASFSRCVFIDVGPSRVSEHDMNMVAALFSMWFADADVLYYSSLSDNFWGGVSLRIRRFRKVRRMERRWIRDAQNQDPPQPSLE